MKSRLYPSIKKHTLQNIQTKIIGFAIVKKGTTNIETTTALADGGRIYRIYPSQKEAEIAVSYSPNTLELLIITVVTGV